MAKTPRRTFRIRDEVFLPAKRKAKALGINLTDIVVDRFVEFVGDEDWSEDRDEISQE